MKYLHSRTLAGFWSEEVGMSFVLRALGEGFRVEEGLLVGVRLRSLDSPECLDLVPGLRLLRLPLSRR